MKDLFGPVVNLMEKALSLRVKRNSILASNIANVDTPGYRAKDLNFEGLINSFMENEQGISRPQAGSAGKDLPLETTDPRHIKREESGPPPIVLESKERGVPNNVDLDEQMAKLAENNLQYQITTQMLIKKFEILKTAITEGGKQ